MSGGILTCALLLVLLASHVHGQCCDLQVTGFTTSVTHYDTSVATNFDYTITIKNLDTVNVIGAATPPAINYNIEMKFAEYDLLSVGSASDTLAAGVDPATDPASTILPAGVNSIALNPQGSVLISGSSQLTLDTADCPLANYVCVHVFPLDPDSQFNDTLDYNNWLCEPISVNCEVDIEMTSYTPAPTANMQYGISETQSITFTITNTGTTTGEDIAAVTGGNENFNIVWQLAKSDLAAAATPATETIGASIPVSFTSVATTADGLENGQPLVLVGDVTWALPTDATCTDVTHACAVLTVGTGASFQEPDPDVNSNYFCQAVTTPNCIPIINNLPDTVQVPENTTDDASLFTVTVDGGPVTFAIQSQTPTLAGIAIDANTGVVSLTGSSFDFETGTTTFDIVIEANAAGPGTQDVQTLTVEITDVNEEPTLDGTPTTITIDEDFTGVLTGFTLSKTDVDVADGQGITYSIQSFPAGPAATGPFTMAADGKITVGTTPVALDFESNPTHWELEIIGVDTGAPSSPSQLTGTTTLTVSVGNVEDEPPSCAGFPDTIDILENETSAAVIKTINCADPDGVGTVSLNMGISPLTDKFTLTGNTIEYASDPGFDYEETNQYDILIFITDGTTDWTVGNVTVNIIDVVELPWFINLWNNVSFFENFMYGMEVYYIEYGFTPNVPVVNLTMVDAYPYSGLDKFKFYEPSRLIYTRWMPDLNFEVDTWYNLTFDLCAVEGCVRENLTVFIEDENEYPFCDPDNFTLVVGESTAINTNVGLQLSNAVGDEYVQDPDELETHGYSVKPSIFSDYITTQGDNVRLAKAYDYDAHNPPHKFTVTVRTIDKFLDPDQAGLSCHHTLTVYVTNEDDRSPVFESSPPADYILDIPEDTPAGTAIALITVTDMDIGAFGVQDIVVDPTDATALKYFTMGPITRNQFVYTAELQIAGALDVETDSRVIFNLIASDTKPIHDATQQVTVRIQNINDNRPKWAPDFYNYEVSSEAYTGKLIPYGVLQAVTGTDADIIYQTPNYFLVHESADFALDALNGTLTAIGPPYPDYHEYTLYMVIRDNDHEPKTSLVGRTRVDTYQNDDVLTNWTFNCPSTSFSNEATRAQLLQDVATICPPCVPRIHEIYSNGSQTLILMYFLVDNTTDDVGNIGVTKEYIPATEIMELYTTDQVMTPTTAVTSNAALSGCPVTKITYYVVPNPYCNWLLCTIEGNLFLGFLMSIIWTAIMTAVICLFRHCSKDRGEPRRRADTPSKEKRKPPPKRELTPVQEIKQEDDGDFNVMDFRYADRAHVTTAEVSKIKTGL